ncbi:MAG TPA: hypothetical protein VKB19_19830 [Pedobacter sp.]|nr:hypothetical protein [Pedobacter sp.]
MNIKFYIAFILIVLGVSVQSRGQVSYNKRATGSIGTVPKAADFQNSASLENVDYATGTVKIGIPLYEIKVNDISVPITLSYSALGIKVGTEAGAPGMGWELAAGGKIITNMQGRRDGPNFTELYSQSWAYDVISGNVPFNPYQNTAHQGFLNNVLDGVKDAMWDTYNYVLPQGGGTFAANGLTFPYDPTIKFTSTSEIATTDGLIYHFSSGDKKTVTKRKAYDASAVPNPNSWLTDVPTEYTDQDLWKIVSTRFKDTVNFGYQRFDYPHAKLAAKMRINTSESLPLYRDVKPRTVSEGGVANDAQSQWYKISEPIVSQSRTDYKAHTRIKHISFPNGSVIFDYAENDVLSRDVLLSIRVFQKFKNDSTMLKRYVFEMNSHIGYGHYLQALHIYDGKNVWQGAYDFTYHGDRLPVNPTADSFMQDRWGYYNSAISNKTLIEHPDKNLAMLSRNRYPVYNNVSTPGTKEIIYTRIDARDFYGASNPGTINGIITYRINFADRDPKFSSAVAGTIKSVTIPTGGKFEYEYEPNKMTYTNREANQSSTLTFINGGGIRLKKLTKSMQHGAMYSDYYRDSIPVLVKRYVYGDAPFNQAGGANETNGYGIGTIPGTALSNLSKYYDAGSPSVDYDVYNVMLLSHPVNSLSQHGGSTTIYQSVTEYLNSAADTAVMGALGKTVYYSDPLPEGQRSDFLWQGIGASPEYPNLPFAMDRPGVERAYPTGSNGYRKYARKSGGGFRILEQGRSFHTSFDAPVNTTNRLVSLVASPTGQMSGPYPGTSAPRDMPKVNPLGGGLYLFNNFVGTSNVGVMDYIAYNNVAQESNTVVYPQKYYYKLIDLNHLSNCVKKTRDEKMFWDDNEYTAGVVNTTYYYDNLAHMLPTRIATLNSKGDSVITRNKYPQDYPVTGTVIDHMKTNKLSLTDPVESYTTYKAPAGPIYVTSGSINTYKQEDNVVYSDKVYQMKVNNELTPYAASGFNGAVSSIDTNKFKPQVSYDLYVKGNVHKYAEQNAGAGVVIWGYNNQYPIAKVANANNISSNTSGRFTSADVAYTSFERNDAGNWTYAGIALADTTGPSGKKVYSLVSGDITKTNPTPAGMKYVISYWYKNGASVTITGGTVGALTVRNTWSNWTLVEREISNVTGIVKVAGSGFIDELRFHPADAQMSTYLYEPLIGLTTVIDAKGALQHYEYDDSQRLKNIRDQRGNIVKAYKYQMGTFN